MAPIHPQMIFTILREKWLAILERLIMKNSKPIVDVTLYLKGENLDPKAVSACLGAEEGSTMRKKEELYSIGLGRRVASKIGLWALESNIDDDSLSGKIAWLRNRLANLKSCPLEIPGVEYIELDLYIELGADDHGDGKYASVMQAEDIRWINEIGACVSVNLSFCHFVILS